MASLAFQLVAFGFLVYTTSAIIVSYSCNKAKKDGWKLTYTSTTCYKTKAVDGGWGLWSVWRDYSPCSVSCGVGSQFQNRTRKCDRPRPSHGGAQCRGNASDSRTTVCASPCPVHGNWSDWGNWAEQTPCSVTCGGGMRTEERTRNCNNPAPNYGGDPCSGPRAENRSFECNTEMCKVDGGWSDWSLWRNVTQCSVTCDGGKLRQERGRKCDNPAPAYKGAPCQGEATQNRTIDCATDKCKVHGKWSEWSFWKTTRECSVKCGGGTMDRRRMRKCNNPAPLYGGNDCSGVNNETDSQSCNMQPCPVNGGWSGWSVWKESGPCSVTCGSGTVEQERIRACDKPKPAHNGSNCAGRSRETKTRPCEKPLCIIDGGWSSFGQWKNVTECNKKCGGGYLTQKKIRTCDNPAPANGGKDCAGVASVTQTILCNNHTCDEGWGNWTDWETEGECSVLCGGGTLLQVRSRVCLNELNCTADNSSLGNTTESCNCTEGVGNVSTSCNCTEGADNVTTSCNCTEGAGNVTTSCNCTGVALSETKCSCEGEGTQNRTLDCGTEACGDRCPFGAVKYLPHPTKENRFYQCSNKIAFLQECGPGEIYHDAGCRPPTADSTGPQCDPAIPHQLLPHPQNSNKYYVCVHGNKVLMSCAGTLMFVPEKGWCDF